MPARACCSPRSGGATRAVENVARGDRVGDTLRSACRPGRASRSDMPATHVAPGRPGGATRSASHVARGKRAKRPCRPCMSHCTRARGDTYHRRVALQTSSSDMQGRDVAPRADPERHASRTHVARRDTWKGDIDPVARRQAARARRHSSSCLSRHVTGQATYRGQNGDQHERECRFGSQAMGSREKSGEKSTPVQARARGATHGPTPAITSPAVGLDQIVSAKALVDGDRRNIAAAAIDAVERGAALRFAARSAEWLGEQTDVTPGTAKKRRTASRS